MTSGRHQTSDDKCKFSFWYIEVSACYVYNLVYSCRSLLEQQIELVLIIIKQHQIKKNVNNLFKWFLKSDVFE